MPSYHLLEVSHSTIRLPCSPRADRRCRRGRELQLTRTGAVTLTAADVAAMPDDSVDLLTVYSLDRTGIGDTVTAINTGLAACAAAGVTAIAGGISLRLTDTGGERRPCRC